MGVNDIVLQISKYLGDIVKPTVLNEIQKAREKERHQHD